MKYLILAVPFMLSGCYQSVNINDIETAIEACGGIDKVYEVSAMFNGAESVTCTNRTAIYLNERVWAKK